MVLLFGDYAGITGTVTVFSGPALREDFVFNNFYDPAIKLPG
jgi:hypothetical protein